MGDKFKQTAHRDYERIIVLSVNETFKRLPKSEQFRIKDYSHIEKQLKRYDVPYQEKWLRSGYSMWKPVMILEALQLIPQDTYLVYHDLNLDSYGDYHNNIALSPRKIISSMKKRSILAFRQYGKRCFMDTKSKLISEFELNEYSLGYWAGCIVIKNNREGRSFIESWISLCIPQNALPLPDAPKSNRNRKFITHSSDQAILGALITKELRKRNGNIKTLALLNRNIHGGELHLRTLASRSKSAILTAISKLNLCKH